MNIEIANRLVQLRKKCGYSQEELAGKLGLSRQSVSKWERAEASPDTDNLIELARLYNVSLDDLLNPEVNLDEVINKAEKNPNEGEHVDDKPIIEEESESSTININGRDIYIKDGNDEVHIKRDGVHVYENGKETQVKVFNHKHHDDRSLAEEIASGIFSVLVIIGYLLFGFLYEDHAFAWGIGWTAILLIPVFTSVFECARKHRVSRFAYPVLIAAAYCFLGILLGLWHPLWVMFLTIPVFYGIATPIDRVLSNKYPSKKHVEIDEDGDIDIDED